MSVVGAWTLHYDWGCDGSYSNTGITLNSDGTFTTSGGLSGEWVQIEGMVMWSFNTGPAKYGGNVIGSAMVGMMTTFSGLDGCWYATKAGSTTLLAAERKPEYDESGEKARYNDSGDK